MFDDSLYKMCLNSSSSTVFTPHPFNDVAGLIRKTKTKSTTRLACYWWKSCYSLMTMQNPVRPLENSCWFCFVLQRNFPIYGNDVSQHSVQAQNSGLK